jgi:hypothetical protein
MSAFDTAAMTGQYQTVCAMLNASPDVDITSHGPGDDTSMEHTVLFMAACGGQREILVRLLAHADACGATPEQKRCSLFAGQLHGHERSEPAVCQAAALGYGDVVEVILTAGLSERDCRDSEGRTALQHACHHGHDRVAKVVFAGCTVDAARELLLADDDYGRNSFDIAAAAGHPDCLAYLLLVAAQNGIGLASALSRVSQWDGSVGWTVFEHASARPPMAFGSERSADAVAAGKVECIDILLRHPETTAVPFRRVLPQERFRVGDEDGYEYVSQPSQGAGHHTAFALAASSGHRSGRVLLHLLQLEQSATPRQWDGHLDNKRQAMIGAMYVVSEEVVRGSSSTCEPDPVLDECMRHLLAGGGSDGVFWHSDQRVLRIVREMAVVAIADRRVRSRMERVDQAELGGDRGGAAGALPHESGWSGFLARAATTSINP